MRLFSSVFARIPAACAAIVLFPTLALAIPPAEALKRFKVAEGFQIKLFAAEPDVRQPVAMNFDDRGRLWVVQYLQYPHPAGLKPVSVDQFLRTKFDRVPEPPPRGPRGADKITICEDTDGDGRADKFKDFVTGLNMATGVAIGHGGVFVAQSPYLLFYPDKNRDDLPDGDPQVLLTGFGMEDSHAYPNSLQFGPDGWLYGAQGSNVWAEVRGLKFNQCVWRYHPVTRKFEVFAEGGGNTWGLDFDRHGQAIAGTNFGGVVGLHMVQGGYYVKGFAKHGPLSNPHAYGYFEHMPYASPQRISQGEHVMCGGVLYQGGAFPKELNDQYITCALLHRAIYWHKIERYKSTYKTDWGGALVTTDDPEFRPVDLAIGPDGSLFIADWHDVRANHVIPEDTWNKETGRIYRLVTDKVKPVGKFDLQAKSDDELVDLLSHENVWHRRAAVRILGERKDKIAEKTAPRLLEKNLASANSRQIETLWALNAISSLSDDAAVEKLLAHRNEYVRAWTVRLIGDRGKITTAQERRLAELAASDPSPIVRSQLASTCKRLSAGDARRILGGLLTRDEDVDDPTIALLIWWAIESKSISDRIVTLETLSDKLWFGKPRSVVYSVLDKPRWEKPPAYESFVIQRLAQRYAAERSDDGFGACARLLRRATNPIGESAVLEGMDQGLTGRPLKFVPGTLQSALYPFQSAFGFCAYGERIPSWDIGLAMKFGDENAYRAAIRLISNPKVPQPGRADLIRRLSDAGRDMDVPSLMSLLKANKEEPIQLALIAALERFDNERIATDVLAARPTMSPAVKSRAVALLTSRKPWAKALLVAVAEKKVPVADISAENARRIALHNDSELNALLEKHVGKFGPQSSAEKQIRIGQLTAVLNSGRGDAKRGQPLYAKHCATCHTLFGEGTKLGPDLTTADRADRNLMLLSIVDPSAGIRQEYVPVSARTGDGRVVTGLVVESTDETVTLASEKNERTTLVRDEIEEFKPQSQSLMPEKILDQLSEQEVRDLFGYLQSRGK